MALINSSDRRRLEIPHEPGEWIELRPLTVQDVGAVEALGSGGNITVGIGLLSHSIVAWSYDAPVNAETVAQLDMETFQWLMTEVDITSNRRERREKKESNSPSSPPSTRLTTPVASRSNSPTSSKSNGSRTTA